MTSIDCLTDRILERSGKKKFILILVRPKVEEIIKILMTNRVETEIILGYRK